MLLRRIALLATLAVLALPSQSSRIPDEVRSARIVLIENNAGDDSVIDSAHLILASSQFRWMDDPNRADLVFKFDRNVSEAKRRVEGDKILMDMRNTYTLDVVDRSGKSIWKGSADLDPSNLRKDKTERSWIEYLHRHPAAQLVIRFLADIKQ